MEISTKKICIGEHNGIIKAVPTKKIITTKKIWNCINQTDLDYESQYNLLIKMISQLENKELTTTLTDKKLQILRTHINQKLYSYKAQDIAKNRYNENEFVDIKSVLYLLKEKDLDCHYCRKKVMILYEYIREPLQWTLDRIDNSFGHNRGNLYISCLTCNLRRRCLHAEKYVITKKCANIVKLPAAGAPKARPYSPNDNIILFAEEQVDDIVSPDNSFTNADCGEYRKV